MNWIRVGSRYYNLDSLMCITDLRKDRDRIYMREIGQDDDSESLSGTEGDEFMEAFTNYLSRRGANA